MTIQEADDLIVAPLLQWMGAPYESDEARVLLLAIGQQETRFKTRVQEGGPARSFWQFEFGKGAAGYAFCTSPKFAPFRALAKKLHFVVNDPAAVKLQFGAGADKLACIAARGLLYLDPEPLPELGDVEGAWAYYVRNWRPGAAARSTRPHAAWTKPATGNYALAHQVVTSGA